MTPKRYPRAPLGLPVARRRPGPAKVRVAADQVLAITAYRYRTVRTRAIQGLLGNSFGLVHTVGELFGV